MVKPWVKLHQLGGQHLGDSIIDGVDKAFVQTEGYFVVHQQVHPSELRPGESSQNPNVSDHSNFLILLLYVTLFRSEKRFKIMVCLTTD